MKKTYINPDTKWVATNAIVLATVSNPDTITLDKNEGNPDESFGKEVEDEFKSVWDEE